MHATLTADTPDLTAAVPGIPPALAKLVMRLLEKNPQARFLSAQDLAWALEQLVDVSATARTLSRDTPARRRASWRGWVAATAVIAAGVLGAGSTRLVEPAMARPTSLAPCDLGTHFKDWCSIHRPSSTRRQRIVFAARADARRAGCSFASSRRSSPSSLPERRERSSRSGRRMDGGAWIFRAASPRSSRSQVERPSHSLMRWTAAAGRGAAGIIVYQPDLIGSGFQGPGHRWPRGAGHTARSRAGGRPIAGRLFFPTASIFVFRSLGEREKTRRARRPHRRSRSNARRAAVAVRVRSRVGSRRSDAGSVICLPSISAGSRSAVSTPSV